MYRLLKKSGFLCEEFACNGTVVDHPEYREVIQLQGDQRMHMQEFLVKYGLAREDQIKVIKCFIKILAFGMSTLIRPLSWKIVNV